MNKATTMPADSQTHLTMVMRFEKCPSTQQIISLIEKKLFQYKRLRSIPRPNPDAVYESRFEEVGECDAKRHVHERDVSGEDEVLAKINEFVNRPPQLPAGSPLFRFDILRNASGNSAVVWRVDHCVGDGIGLMPVGLSLTTDKDGRPVSSPAFTRRRASSSDAFSALVSLKKRILGLLSDLKTIAGLATQPFDNCTSINANADSDDVMKRHNGKRKTVILEFPLDSLKGIRAAYAKKYTINDIITALFAGASLRYMKKMGPSDLEFDDIKMSGLAPFAMPRKSKPGAINNKMAMMSFRFPMNGKSTDERMELAHKEFQRLKDSLQVPILFSITEIGVQLGLEKAIVDTNTKLFHRTSWIFSNVKGPEEPLYVLGHEMKGFTACYNNAIHQAIFFSYNGTVSASLTMDTASIKNPDFFKSCFMDELKAVVGEKSVKTSGAKAEAGGSEEKRPA